MKNQIFRTMLLRMLFFPALAFSVESGTADRAQAACKLFLENVGRAVGTDPSADLKRGQDVFTAAAGILQEGTGVTLPQDGRRVAIRAFLMDPLIDGFIKEYTDAGNPEGRKGRLAAPINIAGGNVGHMQDHLDFYEKYKGDFEKHLGVDPKSLKLALVAHDIGKGFLDDFMDLYVANRTNKDFLKQYVLAHEFHSIANIPKVVQKVVEAQGIDPNSKQGRKMIFGASLQIMEMIRYHNGVQVQVVEKMKERYPDLDPSEIEAVMKAWWPQNYKRFALDFADVGLKADYGTKPSGAIPAVVNFIDRVTLNSPSGPAKLAKQSFGQLGNTKDLFDDAIATPARTNMPLVIAQASQLRPYLLQSEVNPRDLAPVAEGQAYSNRMLALGNHLAEMNKPEVLNTLPLSIEDRPLSSAKRKQRISEAEVALGLPQAKLLADQAKLEVETARLEGRDTQEASGKAEALAKKVADLTKAASVSVKQYLYYKVGETWHRVEGSDAANGVTQSWDGSSWKVIKEGGHPVDHLMELVAKNGAWPKT